MYDEKTLAAYPFFSDLMRRVSRIDFHDSLTGLIARPYMLEFIRSLISNETPFSMAMIDLDNFKDINDHYGHRIGDDVLAAVAEGLRNYTGADGIAGRFGGDEFLLVYLKSNEYSQLHAFYDGMFVKSEGKETIFRKYLVTKDAAPYITATLGSCSYPENASDFDGLFALMDKALYRGKTKGRNCFIIYVPAKHANLEITTMTCHNLYNTCRMMTQAFQAAGEVEAKLLNAFQYIKKNLGLTSLLWIDESGVMHDLENKVTLGRFENIDVLMKNGLYAPTDFKEMADLHPALCSALKKLGNESALIMQAGQSGYLVVCPEKRTFHIWQDVESAAVYLLAVLLDFQQGKQ